MAPRTESDDPAQSGDRLDVAVSGGSMAGLFTALALGKAGHEVTVFERATGELKSRGAGIVAQPRMLRYMDEGGVANPEELTLTTGRREYLNRDGNVRHEQRDSMTFTAWDAVYRRLRGAVDEERYRMGQRVEGFEQDDTGVTVRVADGEARADLLVVAEGGRSASREELCPGVSPEYAGYVAWRGLFDETEASQGLIKRFEDTFLFFEGEEQLILGYLIPGPGGETERGARRLNWVWYDNADTERLSELLTDSRGENHDFSVPPGALREDVEREMYAAANEGFPEVFCRLIEGTPEPFVQTIYDRSVPQMVFDRVCLLGDAAFVARPHTAAGTAKAAADAIDLGKALGEGGVESLDDWEEKRLAAGERLVREGIRMGEGYMDPN